MSEKKIITLEQEEMARATMGLGPPTPELLLDVPKGEVRPIFYWPDPVLGVPCADVPAFDEALKKLVSDLALTMYTVGGVGLSAPQIGIPLRVFVVDRLASEEPKAGRPASQLLVAVNPKLWVIDEAQIERPEGCLSFPGVYESIPRPSRVAVKAFNHRGEPWAMALSHDLSQAVQHEYDHVEGVTMLEHMDGPASFRTRMAMEALHKRLGKTPPTKPELKAEPSVSKGDRKAARKARKKARRRR